MRSFRQLLHDALEIARFKSLAGFKGNVSMKVTKDEFSLVAGETFDGKFPVLLCGIPLRMINE